VDRIAHSGNSALGSGVLEVAFGEPDHKRIWCDVRSPDSSRAAIAPIARAQNVSSRGTTT